MVANKTSRDTTFKLAGIVYDSAKLLCRMSHANKISLAHKRDGGVDYISMAASAAEKTSSLYTRLGKSS